MKVGKYINDEFVTVICENGKETSGGRTLEELYTDGYKDVCEIKAPSETSICTYEDYDSCYVQIWNEVEYIPEEDFSVEEVLD